MLLERIDDTIHQPHLQPLVNIRHSESSNYLSYGLHHHLSVWLGFILELIHNSPYNFHDASLLRKLSGGFNDLVLQIPEICSTGVNFVLQVWLGSSLL